MNARLREPGQWSAWMPWLEGGLLVLAVLLVLAPISPWNYHAVSRDSGVFLYIGWRLLEGDTPYLDVWDHKPPGIYFLDAAGLSLGHGTSGVWVLEVLFLLAGAYLAWRLLRRLFGPQVTWVVMFLWLINLFAVLAGGNLTQEYALPFQFAMLALFLRTARTGIRPRWALLLGALLGVTFLIRQTSIGIGLSILLYWVGQGGRSRQWRRVGRMLLAVIAGGLLVSLPVVVYLASRGALSAFWDQAFRFNFFYMEERSALDRLLALSTGLGALSRAGLVPFALVGYVLCWLGVRQRWDAWAGEHREVAALLIIALPVELVLVSLGGRPRLPYFMTLLPVLAVLAGFALAPMLDGLGRLRAPRWRWLVALALLAMLGLTQVSEYVQGVRTYRHARYAEEAVQYVRSHTSPDDQVLLIGAETAVNFLARRRSPTRFVYQYPLYRVAYAGASMLEAFYQDILRQEPRLIIVTIGDGSIPNRFGANKTPRSEALVYEIAARYRRVAEVDSWVVYERIEAP